MANIFIAGYSENVSGFGNELKKEYARDIVRIGDFVNEKLNESFGNIELCSSNNPTSKDILSGIEGRIKCRVYGKGTIPYSYPDKDKREAGLFWNPGKNRLIYFLDGDEFSLSKDQNIILVTDVEALVDFSRNYTKNHFGASPFLVPKRNIVAINIHEERKDYGLF